jgi:hypothetical protein
MSDQQPESESLSEVRGSSHLFVVTVGECRLGEWMPLPDSALSARFVELSLGLEQILKGRIDQICGESTTICVQQRGTGSRRVSDDYGVWSKVELQRGQRLVAFCSSASSDLADLLQPPHCLHLAGVDVLPDLHTCLDLEGRQLPPAELVTRLSPLLAWRSGVLARYLWACTGQAALADLSVFELHMQIVERPNTSAEAREVLTTAAYEELSMRETSPCGQMKRLTRAMFVMLTVPEAHTMHENLARVYLPNLIGLSRGRAEIGVSEVFAEGSRTKARVQDLLTTRPALDPEGLVSRWLAQG